MSYDVHITKADHWTRSELSSITEKDIKELKYIFDYFPLLFLKGRLTLCGADNAAIGLLVEAANKIGARVQGDEGEFYGNEYLDFINYIYKTQTLTLGDKVEDNQEINHFMKNLSAGTKIMHGKFGEGTIKEIFGEGNDKELIVDFSSINKSKRILAYYSPIKILNN
ncbi:hypothetical protein [Paenibacillus caui]|uniref:hypothetical protein n=1 Tax=Paenibacillus caui TaxID=2873927 RepID=UPI001CA8E1A5|nr:hypothetical protein [Paenibacillus caui]